MYQRIVITGGGGFVGTHLIAELQRAWPDCALVVWDKVALHIPAVTSEVIDLTQPTTYTASLAALQPAWIVHLAAQAAVGESFKDPKTTQAINTLATAKMLEAITIHSPSTHVLAVSSADIYGQGTPTPLAELPLAEAHPRNPYGQSKWDMEKVIEERFNERVLRVRPFPHIGPGQRLGFVTADFASQIAAIEAGAQAPVIKVGNLAAQRDFTDVRDVVRAYRLLMEKNQVGQVYHVATGHAVTIQHILDQLLKLTTVSIKIAHDSARTRPIDIPILVGDASKLRQLVNWQPEIPLTQTLADVLNWWRSRVQRDKAPRRLKEK